MTVTAHELRRRASDDLAEMRRLNTRIASMILEGSEDQLDELRTRTESLPPGPGSRPVGGCRAGRGQAESSRSMSAPAQVARLMRTALRVRAGGLRGGTTRKLLWDKKIGGGRSKSTAFRLWTACGLETTALEIRSGGVAH